MKQHTLSRPNLRRYREPAYPNAADRRYFVEKAVNIVTAILDEVVKALARGDRVELRGFGAFSRKARSARIGRNPRTGDAVEVEEKFVPVFKTGKELRLRLNGKA